MSLLRGFDRRRKGRVRLLVWCMVRMSGFVIWRIALLVQPSWLSAVILRTGRNLRPIILGRVRRFRLGRCVWVRVVD